MSSLTRSGAPETQPARPSVVERAALCALAAVAWTHVVFFLVAYGFNASLAWARGEAFPGFFAVWLKWDAVAFLRIALHGYTSALTEPHPTAFFPLLPLLLRGSIAFHLGGAEAGLLISAVASLVAFFYLYRLAEAEVGPGSGTLSVWFLALFPASVFLVAGYTEPIFLAGAIAAFFYAREGSWRKVALPAAIATASRFSGLFVLAALAIEALRQWRASGRSLAEPAGALAVGALPVAAYCFFLQRARGDPLFYFTDERLGWHRRFVSPFRALINTFHHPGAPIEIAAALLGLAFVIWSARTKQWSYLVYMLLLLTSLVTSAYYLSIPRLLLSFFPAPLLLAGLTRNRPNTGLVILLISAALSVVGVVAFTYGLGFY
ncbi:MAG TPA: hypothetical protein VHV50_11060 [Actinomycetota bacterium]|nr:hypothetical protein [Actinomycetota bacterium]